MYEPSLRKEINLLMSVTLIFLLHYSKGAEQVCLRQPIQIDFTGLP